MKRVFSKFRGFPQPFIARRLEALPIFASDNGTRMLHLRQQLAFFEPSHVDATERKAVT